ncbi:MAG: glycosyltransferase [Bacilli bacterium]|nr:glycosyltransferase [Bacilli bacterium]
MKYSFIVSVYNGEPYISTCLDSLVNQTYAAYEIIIIDDGSTDKSLPILKKYAERYKQIKLFHQENRGLSASRNRGIDIASGDYFLFVDIDDFVDVNMLSLLEAHMEEDLDLLKFNYKELYPDGTEKVKETSYQGTVLKGDKAIQRLITDGVLFEMAVLYAYKTSYMKQNKLLFTEGRYHEDFGLIPYTLIKSNKIKILDFVFYTYVQTENSITRNEDVIKTVKRAYDVLYYNQTIKKKVKPLQIEPVSKQLLYSYMANAALRYVSFLKGEEQKKYREELKKQKVINDLLANTFQQKIKKRIKKWKNKL